jgi:hypothetical protein
MKLILFFGIVSTLASWPVIWEPISTSPLGIKSEAAALIATETPKVYLIPRWNDLLDESIPAGLIDEVFGLMQKRPEHLFIVCTKNPERLQWMYDELSVYHHIIIFSSGPIWPHVKEYICGIIR